MHGVEVQVAGLFDSCFDFVGVLAQEGSNSFLLIELP